MFNLEQGKKLVELARISIESYFTKQKIDMKRYEEFSQKQGVFVTLTKHGDLRGCIGFPEPIYPLNRAVFEAARAAAFEDPRFLPVKEKELDEIEIEVSVLTLPKLIDVKRPEEYLDKIVIGRDGLIIRSPFSSGLLLPQVPVEWGWNVEEFLEHLCEKAGLDIDAWKMKDVKIYSFQAQIFSEKRPKGEVVEKEL